jgi:hypothetical protein
VLAAARHSHFTRTVNTQVNTSFVGCTRKGATSKGATSKVRWVAGGKSRGNYVLPQVLRVQNFELKCRIAGGVTLGGIFRRRSIPDRKFGVTIGTRSAKMRLGGATPLVGLGCALPVTLTWCT